MLVGKTMKRNKENKNQAIGRVYAGLAMAAMAAFSLSAHAAPPGKGGAAGHDASFGSWTSNTAESVTALPADAPSTVLGDLDKPGKAKNKTGKRFKAPAKLAEKHPELAGEWTVQGMPATLEEVAAKREKIARKEKLHERVKEKKEDRFHRGQR